LEIVALRPSWRKIFLCLQVSPDFRWSLIAVSDPHISSVRRGVALLDPPVRPYFQSLTPWEDRLRIEGVPQNVPFECRSQGPLLTQIPRSPINNDP
jgi:hypothetical protein